MSQVVINNIHLKGTVRVPESKSLTHRYLIAEALSGAYNKVIFNNSSEDIAATRSCLRELGLYGESEPPVHNSKTCILDCNESATTYRFLLPIAAALGKNSMFVLKNSLTKRPADPLLKALKAHGIRHERRDFDDSYAEYGAVSSVYISGKLTGGSFILPGNVSSQFISGLMFALPLLEVNSTIIVEGPLESASYVAMTMAVMRQAGIKLSAEKGTSKIGYIFKIPGNQRYRFGERKITIENDWSSAAFFLVAGAICKGPVTCTGLNINSIQGDKRIIDILKAFGANVSVNGKSITVSGGRLTGIDVDARDIPDLIPAVALLGTAASGITNIINAKRLRYKESDRLSTISKTLNYLGAEIDIKNDSLVIDGLSSLDDDAGHAVLVGGRINSCGDHRIAMMAGISACICRKPVEIIDCDVVNKSYPQFFKDLEDLQYN